MPRPAIHPGEILAEELTELGVAPTELSRQINVPPNRMTQIIHRRRGITGDAALRLGHWFGTSAQFRLNLQSATDICVAEEPRSPTSATAAGKREVAKVAESCRASFSGDIFLTEAPGVPILFFRWIKGALNLTRPTESGRIRLAIGETEGKYSKAGVVRHSQA